MCVTHIPSPAANARNKVETIYTGPHDTELAESMFECDPDVSNIYQVTFFKVIMNDKKRTIARSLICIAS